MPDLVRNTACWFSHAKDNILSSAKRRALIIKLAPDPLWLKYEGIFYISTATVTIMSHFGAIIQKIMSQGLIIQHKIVKMLVHFCSVKNHKLT